MLANNPDMTIGEKNFVDFFITLFTRTTVKTLSELYAYESKECFLKSINSIWKNSGVIRSTSEGFKADGIVRYRVWNILHPLWSAFRQLIQLLNKDITMDALD